MELGERTEERKLLKSPKHRNTEGKCSVTKGEAEADQRWTVVHRELRSWELRKDHWKQSLSDDLATLE